MNLTRWALFFARTWAIPFCFGMFAAMVIAAYSQTEIISLFSEAFDNSFQTVIKSCAR